VDVRITEALPNSLRAELISIVPEENYMSADVASLRVS